MARWDWLVANLGGEVLGELSQARGRSLEFDLKAPASAKWSIDGRHEQAKLAKELTTDLLCYRDRRLIFRGRIASSDDDIDAEEHKVNFSAVDYGGVLGARILDDNGSYEGRDAFDIGWDLVVWASFGRVQPVWSDLRITRGPRPAGMGALPRPVWTVTAETTVLQALDDLSDVFPGFDWWVDPSKVFHMASPRGVVRPDFPLVLGTTVTKVHRQLDTQAYGNRIRVRGGKPDNPDDERRVDTPAQLPAQGGFFFDAWWVGAADARQDRNLYVWTPYGWLAMEEMPVPSSDRWAADLGARTEGRIDRVHSNSDLKTVPETDAAADFQLSLVGNLRPSYSFTLRPDRPFWDPEACWLGDVCDYVIHSGRLDVHDTDRVQQLSISLDESDVETVTVTLGRRRTELAAWFRTVPERIERLERR